MSIRKIDEWHKRDDPGCGTKAIREFFPEVLTCGTLLYIGIRPCGWRGVRYPNNLSDWLNAVQAAGGYVDGVEAWWKYVERLRTEDGKPPWLRHLYQGDICHFDVDVGYEVVCWYHGPEHAPNREEGQKALSNCEKIASKYVVIICPWGVSINDTDGGFAGDPPNPLEAHGWQIVPEDLDERGYEVIICNCRPLEGPNADEPCGHILACKETK